MKLKFKSSKKVISNERLIQLNQIVYKLLKWYLQRIWSCNPEIKSKRDIETLTETYPKEKRKTKLGRKEKKK